MRFKSDMPIGRLLGQIVRVYHALMERFTAPNGEEVVKVVTPSGVTGYIAASVPAEALIGMRDKMIAKLGMTLPEFRKKYGLDRLNEPATPSR